MRRWWKWRVFQKNFETTTFFSTFWWFHSFPKSSTESLGTCCFFVCGVGVSRVNQTSQLNWSLIFFGALRMWSTSSNKTSNLVSSKWATHPGCSLEGPTPWDLDGAVPELKRPKAPLIFLGRVLVQYILGLILLLGSVWRSLFVSFCDEQMFHIFGHISSWYIELLVVLKNTSLKLDPSIGKKIKKHLDLERLHTWMQLCNALLGGGSNPSEKY